MNEKKASINEPSNCIYLRRDSSYPFTDIPRFLQMMAEVFKLFLQFVRRRIEEITTRH